MDNNELLRKCNKCKITKPKELFYKYKYCKRCHIKDYIRNHLLDARVANHFNLSMEDFNNIMTSNMNDPIRNGIEEHERYDEIMVYYCGTQSSIITDDIINNFLDEVL
jgi:hypothetical protein